MSKRLLMHPNCCHYPLIITLVEALEFLQHQEKNRTALCQVALFLESLLSYSAKLVCSHCSRPVSFLINFRRASFIFVLNIPNTTNRALTWLELPTSLASDLPQNENDWENENLFWKMRTKAKYPLVLCRKMGSKSFKSRIHIYIVAVHSDYESICKPSGLH